ncbi:MAG: RluA family pseudouridine synthase [Patescibacteria group bacterium]
MKEPTILFENEDVLVVDKPAGLLVHPEDPSGLSGTLAGWLLSRVPHALGVGEDSARPGVVHRLDQDTSGVMILAKTARAYAKLKSQFGERKVTKVYRAIVEGVVKEDRGVIDRALVSDPEERRQKTAPRTDTLAREALTYWKVVERFPKSSCTYLEAYPKTGRTHQIRIHMRSIGHPIVCDEKYGGKAVCPFGGLSRHALHAYSLEITLPGEEAPRQFVAEEPADFAACLKALRA